MLAQYKKNTNIGVGLGIVLQLIGRFLSSSGSEVIGLVVVLIGLVAFIWGCSQYAKGKGYAAWLGALGLLSIIGLIVLVLLPDKHKNG